MSDVSLEDFGPRQQYFRFSPDTAEVPVGGKVFTPLMGEVESGRIYVQHNPDIVKVLVNHSDWQMVNKSQYDAQEKGVANEE